MTTSDIGTTTEGRKRLGHVPGEVGAWVFILGDMLVFAVFFCTYLYYRAQSTALFDTSQASLDPRFGVTNMCVLLVSSLCVVLGVKATRQGVAGIAPPAFVAAFCCGAVFATLKAIEYYSKVSEGVTPATNEFFMLYFVLTGLHLFHLILGMAVLLVLIGKSRSAHLAPGNIGFIEGGACFWHMVDLLWIILFPLIYLVK